MPPPWEGRCWDPTPSLEGPVTWGSVGSVLPPSLPKAVCSFPGHRWALARAAGGMLCVKAPVRLQGGIFQWRQGVLGEKHHPATLSLCFLSPCGSLPGVHSGQMGAGGARRNFQSDPGEC